MGLIIKISLPKTSKSARPACHSKMLSMLSSKDTRLCSFLIVPAIPVNGAKPQGDHVSIRPRRAVYIYNLTKLQIDVFFPFRKVTGLLYMLMPYHTIGVMLEPMDEATGQPVKHMDSVGFPTHDGKGAFLMCSKLLLAFVFSAAEWYGN